MTVGFHLLLESTVFFVIATGFLAIAGWAWRHVNPFELPKPLPGWFKYWFGLVQVLGILLPLGALVWAIWQGEPLIWMIFAAYFLLLGLQILTEFLTLKQLKSVVWVMVPYLYVPYRLWQLYEGFELTTGRSDLAWIQLLLAAEIVVWGISYLLTLAQLPRLFRWQ